MDKHNKHSKNKNKGVNKPQLAPGSGVAPVSSGSATEAAPAAKPQPKPAANKQK